MPSDEYIVKLALPEGAQIKSYSTGSDVSTRFELTKSFSYLDFIGRPTLVFSFDNYLPSKDQNAKIFVEYTFQKLLIFIEPLYLVVGLSLCFLLYTVFSKIDLSFGSEEYAEKEELANQKKPKTNTHNTPISKEHKRK